MPQPRVLHVVIHHLHEFTTHNPLSFIKMDLFGVQELPNSKSISGPGYAFVPDLGPQSATTAASRKRSARKELSSTAGERTAASDAKILRELAALDKESARDVVIPVPIRARDGAGRGECFCDALVSYRRR